MIGPRFEEVNVMIGAVTVNKSFSQFTIYRLLGLNCLSETAFLPTEYIENTGESTLWP